MADCGGLPQVVQVGLGVCAHAKLSNLNALNDLILPRLYLCSQPGKLAEAFKYFVQGMGYSKYSHSHLLSVYGVKASSC